MKNRFVPVDKVLKLLESLPDGSLAGGSTGTPRDIFDHPDNDCNECCQLNVDFDTCVQCYREAFINASFKLPAISESQSSFREFDSEMIFGIYLLVCPDRAYVDTRQAYNQILEELKKRKSEKVDEQSKTS